nr:MAG TPA: hypothetical protein [Microviridae sp.]
MRNYRKDFRRFLRVNGYSRSARRGILRRFRRGLHRRKWR